MNTISNKKDNLMVSFFTFLEKERKTIIQNWIRIVDIQLGWIHYFDRIIIKYVMLSVLLNSSKNIYHLITQAKCFQLLNILRGHNEGVNSVRFSPDGQKIVSILDDHTIHVWDVISGKRIQIFKGHLFVIYTAMFATDGRIILQYDRPLWDVDISPDGKTIISSSSNRTIQIWDAKSETIMKILSINLGAANNVRFSSNGQMFISASNDDTIVLWSMKLREQIKKFIGHSDSVQSAKFSPDDKFIVSCSNDKTIRIWDVETGNEIKKFEGHSRNVIDVKYFPDGQTIVSCSNETIRLWNVKLGCEVERLKECSKPITGIDEIYKSGDNFTIYKNINNLLFHSTTNILVSKRIPLCLITNQTKKYKICAFSKNEFYNLIKFDKCVILKNIYLQMCTFKYLSPYIKLSIFLCASNVLRYFFSSRKYFCNNNLSKI
ncbi:platelet-activating factor acetylhydrolase isoform 1B alpha subunit [Reticulomyxa filosa]|uniref:Platelet-activating factor acetylhydrolase isoform 1B alpha subunit n=1 Tax=Reticulomyxa filosa TaxID=46433 RepID=X6LN78_RETFI|nr:platelet-activating factor acetylhydrolase isoform 1B alpha subunit [Reticulomyxa filosa]|eukprot:ETO03069.1 platelet-activating factor acetylhydrolase isoform 1B alpha subunit [Reticulomyxa filosa]